MGKSKKGANYEREFCKQLSLWWSFGKWDDVFWRTSQSGGRATTRMKKGKRTADAYGDVGAERNEGRPLTQDTFFELKRGYTGKKGKKGIRFLSIIDIVDTPEGFKKEPLLLEWWKEAEAKRIEAGRLRTFIIFRRDRKVACIVADTGVLNELEDKNELVSTNPSCTILYKDVVLSIIRVDDFFKWCDPRSLGGKRIIKRREKYWLRLIKR